MQNPEELLKVDEVKEVDHSWFAVTHELVLVKQKQDVVPIDVYAVSHFVSDINERKEASNPNGNVKGVIDNRNNNRITCFRLDSS